MKCPCCPIELTELKAKGKIIWTCSNCKGCAVGIGLLQNYSEQEVIQSLWVQIKENQQQSKRKCPDCKKIMFLVRGDHQVQNIELDVCSNCMFFWFDADELSKFPSVTQEEVERRNTEVILRNNLNMFELQKSEGLTSYANDENGQPINATMDWRRRRFIHSFSEAIVLCLQDFKSSK